MNSPLISVVMAVHNAQDTIKKSIDSILCQSIENFEFIIIDDGSVDDTSEILKSYESIDERIKIIRTDHRGLTPSLNLGVKNVEGKYIARQDADDYSSTERFAKQMSVLESKHRVGVVASYYSVYSNQESLEVLVTPKISDFPHRNIFAHGCLMFRSSLLKNNLYDERYIYAQDYELLYRLSRQTEFFIYPENLYYLRRDLEFNHEKFFFYKQIDSRSLNEDRIPNVEHLNEEQIILVKKIIEKEYYGYWASILRKQSRFRDAFKIYTKIPQPYTLGESIRYSAYLFLAVYQYLYRFVFRK